MPSQEELERQQKQAVAVAVEQAQREMAARVAVTLPESVDWVNRLTSELWLPFVVPLMLNDNIAAWQEKVRRGAPSGWELAIQEMELGQQSPRLSNFQVYNSVTNGRMNALECDMRMESTSMHVVVAGSGPLGKFRATVSGITVSGRMRILPIPEHRMLLWSFLGPPDMAVKLQVKGPLIGERDVPQFSFIRNAFAAALQARDSA
ncbi:uncharacterized protein HaLaN_14251, partial [Haematococcus lacustris]